MIAQAWFSIAGLALDILGFSMIVGQWFIDWRNRRNDAIATDYELKIYARGKRPEPHPLEDKPDALMAAIMKHLKFDIRIVGVGAILVLIGFVLQIIGAWPDRFPRIGITP